MYQFLIVLTMASSVGLQAWLILFNNFAVEVAGLQGKHVVMIQSVREIPGFLALLAIFVIILIKDICAPDIVNNFLRRVRWVS